MTDRYSDDPTSKLAAAARREREVHARVESLFRHCEGSKNPVLAYSRACSKVGYLARDGERSVLHYLESALNERKHALVMVRYGQPEKAKEHNRDCARDLQSFRRGVMAELENPRSPLSTDKLRERIHDNLDAGQWSRAGRDLDDLMRRPDIGKPLPALDTYGRSWNLDEQRFAALQGRIDQCNANARAPEHHRPSSVPQASRQPRHAGEHAPEPTTHPPAGINRASGAGVAHSIQRPDPPAIEAHRQSARTAQREVGKGRGLER